MEFSSRGFQRNTPARPPQAPASGPSGDATPPNGKSSLPHRAFEHVRDSKFLRTLTLVLSVAVLVLFVATVLRISLGANSREFSAVDKSNYQVVALSDGQAYFGKIVAISGKNITLRDVYYLNNQASEDEAQSNVQLIKRGCEVHSPQDQMTIYREQVNFWENLKTDGRVATAIQQWKEQNPEGQTCEDETAPTQQQNNTTPSTNSGSESTAPAGSENPAGAAGGTQPAGTPQTSDTPQATPQLPKNQLTNNKLAYSKNAQQAWHKQPNKQQAAAKDSGHNAPAG